MRQWLVPSGSKREREPPEFLFANNEISGSKLSHQALCHGQGGIQSKERRIALEFTYPWSEDEVSVREQAKFRPPCFPQIETLVARNRSHASLRKNQNIDPDSCASLIPATATESADRSLQPILLV